MGYIKKSTKRGLELLCVRSYNSLADLPHPFKSFSGISLLKFLTVHLCDEGERMWMRLMWVLGHVMGAVVIIDERPGRVSVVK